MSKSIKDKLWELVHIGQQMERVNGMPGGASEVETLCDEAKEIIECLSMGAFS